MRTPQPHNKQFFSFVRKTGTIMVIFIVSVVAIILILLGIIWVKSPGQPKPYLDTNGKPLAGSISEKVFVNINGVRQGMFIKGKNTSNPILLYLHGGMPDYFFTENYPSNLDSIFTVVWWEQRGSGISYNPNIPRDSMTLDQIISDTISVTNYLRERFGVEKIYLMGHSGGTFIGIQTAKQAPELYYAYIGEAQMSYQLESERLAYEYMLEKYKAMGDTSMVDNLKAAPVTLGDGTPPGYVVIRDTAMHSLGIGTMHSMKSVVTGLLIPSLMFHDYTFGEKINMWASKAKSGISIVWSSMLKTDLRKEVTELSIPVYFMEGAYDYTVNYDLAKGYLETLKAPVKGFYTFDQSAHTPMFEEPVKFEKIMKEDVLAGMNNLADVK